MIVLSLWLDHLKEHLPIAHTGDDPEGVHQVRVAGRRIRVWLELAQMSVLGDDLTWLVRGAGRVRDLEVLLEDATLPSAFRTWARQRLSQARAEFIPMLDSRRLAALLAALSLLLPLEEAEAKRGLERFELRVRQRAKAWGQDPSLPNLHALRRALRKLRYALEWLGLEPKTSRELQEVLGRVSDLSLSLRYLDAFEAEGGKASIRYRQKLESSLQEALAAARQAWKEGRGYIKREAGGSRQE